MSTRLFVFVQMEFPSVLGPPDGRYLMRSERDSDPMNVVVLETLGAPRAAGARGALARRRPPAVAPEPEPEPVPSTRVTVVDPVSLSAESQARAWLSGLDRRVDLEAAASTISSVLHAHRVASADPYVHEVSPEQAIAIRAGWGEGEQVASGRWLHARELSFDAAARGGRGRCSRSAALRPQERLAALLGAKSRSLVCEELALRARLDLDHDRPLHAAIELDGALTSAAAELRAEQREDLAVRIAELEKLGIGVAGQARAALAGDAGAIDEEALAHALGRLEAALRARTATGFNVS